MSETPSTRRIPFLLPGIILLVLVLLGALLPAIPQPGMKGILEKHLRQTFTSDFKIVEARFRVFPRPGIEVRSFGLASPALKLDVDKLEMDFSLLSLVSFKPRIAAVGLAGGTAEIPAVHGSSWALLEKGLVPLLPGGGLSRISFSDLTVYVARGPGIVGPLVFSATTGEWEKLSGPGNENLDLQAQYNGGRLLLKTAWYNDEGPGNEKAESGATAAREENNGIEVKLQLEDADLAFSGNSSAAAGPDFKQVVCRRSVLRLDVNGNAGSGLRFSLALKTPDCIWTGADRELLSQGPLELKGSGYFQPRAGYLNLKSSALTGPGAAVLYTRGLVRFKEPFFVDLVSHLKVDDLGACCRYFPGRLLADGSVKGKLTGDLKLVGNLFDAPVFKLRLKADEIVVKGVAEKRDAGGKQPPPVSSLVRFLADWEWLVDCNCQVGSLQVDNLQLKNVSLAAKKKTTQFEIERFAAGFASSGRARLTLVIEDLLDSPHWQASVVTKAVDFSRLDASWPFPGQLDLSLVGGGKCGTGDDYLESAEFDGKWSLRQGSFAGQPLYVAFNRFLARNGRKSWPVEFSGSGKVAFRNRALRLRKFSLAFPGKRRVEGRGSCNLVPVRLDFRGRLREKGYQGSFSLQGNLAAPVFKMSNR